MGCDDREQLRLAWPASHARTHDWSTSPVGPVESWCAALRIAADLVVYSPWPMVLLWGPDLLQIYNDAYAAVFHDGQPAALGQPARQGRPELWRFMAPACEAARQGIARRFDRQKLPLRRQNGIEAKWFDVTFSPVHADGSAIAGVLATFVDRTDGVLAQKARRESEALFNSVMKAVPGFVFIATPEGDNLMVSRQFAEFSGLVAEDLLGAGWLKALHPDDFDRAAATWAQSVNSGMDYEAEYRFRRADGVYRWFLCLARAVRDPSDGRIIRWVGVGIDVDDGKQAEARLVEREAQLCQFIEWSPAALAIFDRNMRYMAVSRRFITDHRLSGEPADLVGRSHYDAIPDIPERWVAVHKRVLAGETLSSDAEPFHRADGHVDWVRWRMEPWRNSSGELAGALLFAESVTALKETETALANLNADLERQVRERTNQLVQSQKLEAVGQLTGGIAHDFNNVLQSLASCLFVIDPLVPQGSRFRVMFEAAHKSIERGARLTQALLAFARRQTLKPEAVEVERLLEDIRPLLERTLGGLIHVIFDLENAPAALIDRAQLESAILNLVINARDAMPSGGSLTLRTGEISIRRPSPKLPRELAPGDYVTITISDTGTGIEAGTLARVFDPFFTTKPFGKGSGLGLSMVQGMVLQSGGAVSIASTPGQGTSVTLFLPRALPASPEAVPAEQRLDVASGQGTILLVDDDDLVRSGVQMTLEGIGYQVLSADKGSTALEILRNVHGIDVLITDFAMPGMDGRKLVHEARRLVPRLPALLITGYADDPANAEPLACLRKPFTSADLAGRLAGLLHEQETS